MNDDGFYDDPGDEEDEARAAVAHDATLPPRLRSQRGGEGELVRRYLQRIHVTSEERAWRGLESALVGGARARSTRRRRWRFGLWVTASAGVVALAGALLWISRGGAPLGSVAVVAPPAPTVARATATGAATAPVMPAPDIVAPIAPASPAVDVGPRTVVTVGARPRALVAGRWRWENEASIDVAPGGAARAVWPTGSGPTVALGTGRASFEVVHKPRPAPFRLHAGPYTFTVLGTVFTVERRPTEVSLAVTQGRVAVSRGERSLALITTGGFWTGTLVTGSPSAKTSTAPAAAPKSAEDDASVVVSCAARGAAGQTPTTRLACWRAQASGGGLRAEVALYKVGTIARDELHEPSEALAAFEELRHRYPDGTLRTEAELSIVGLLARTGRYDEALTESAALLEKHGANERAAELHLLRGNVFREGRGDLGRAVEEYRLAAVAEAGRPATVDEATFLYAVTLEAAGRRLEAVEGYRAYVGRTHAAHEGEARVRLQRLTRP
ncbi:MAG TPA: FecR domain-containing protein [Polyangia bacterium]